jgi:folate-binding protein YgfZ
MHASSPETGPPDAAATQAFPPLAIVPVDGPGAAEFLQGQFTCDVAAVPAGRWTWFGYCLPSGRLLVTGRLVRIGEELLLQVPLSFSDEFAQRLRRFVLRAKVTIHPAWPGTGVASAAGAAAAAAGIAEADLPGPGAAVFGCGILVIGVDAGVWLVHAAPGGQARLAPDDRATAAWREAETRAGAPWVLPDTREAFIPQMIGLDAAGGVSFTKGCYPGQEIVARARYRGTVKRGPYLAKSPIALAPGTPLCATRFGGQQAGTVVQSARAGDRWLVHAVLEHSAAQDSVGVPSSGVLLEGVVPVHGAG